MRLRHLGLAAIVVGGTLAGVPLVRWALHPEPIDGRRGTPSVANGPTTDARPAGPSAAMPFRTAVFDDRLWPAATTPAATPEAVATPPTAPPLSVSLVGITRRPGHPLAASLYDERADAIIDVPAGARIGPYTVVSVEDAVVRIRDARGRITRLDLDLGT
ncbi:MAG: hypothetical protein AB8G96_09995 [Phycisphaerales bacterium]